MTNQPTHPNQLQKEELMNLWRYCFSDSNEFVQWYFQEYYRQEHTYILQEPQQGTIAAAMQANPYTLCVRGQKIPAAYLVGVCSHPAYRGEGYFRRLFPATLAQLAENGVPLTFLLPVNNLLYRPYDFSYTHYRQDYQLDMSEIGDFLRKNPTVRNYNITLLSQPEKHWYLLGEIYETYAKHLHGYAVREEGDWQHHFADWNIDHCHIAYLSRNNEGAAYLVYRLGENTLEILEMAYKTQEDYHMIWQYVYTHRTQAEKLIWSAPMGNTLLEEILHWRGKCILHPHTMTRILSVERLLSQLHYPQWFTGSVYLNLSDPIIAENNGIFSLEINQGIAAVRKLDHCSNNCYHLSITALTLLVMGQATAKDLSARQLLTATENDIPTLDNIFPKTCNFINENF